MPELVNVKEEEVEATKPSVIGTLRESSLTRTMLTSGSMPETKMWEKETVFCWRRRKISRHLAMRRNHIRWCLDMGTKWCCDHHKISSTNAKTWSLWNELYFQPTKCSNLHISRKRISPYRSYSINGIDVKVVSAGKDLGVDIVNHTSWKDHILMIVAKANRLLGRLGLASWRSRRISPSSVYFGEKS